MSSAVLDHRTFAALGDPVRAAIVDVLAGGDATVSELAARFPITLQAISRHIRLLADAGLVRLERVGRSRRVTLETRALGDAAEWLLDHQRRREAQYERLDGLLARMQEETP